MIFPACASRGGKLPSFDAQSLAESPDSLKIEKNARPDREAKERTTLLKTRRFLLVALLAGFAALFFVALRRRRDTVGPVPYARPEGGEREGEFELFIGS